MSRLGDTIRNERLRLGLNPKALAKKCGVSEKFLLEVESGKRIIQDTEAARILKVMGKQQSVLADFEAVADGLPTAAPARPAPAARSRRRRSPRGSLPRPGSTPCPASCAPCPSAASPSSPWGRS